jgi:S1-C subfamily serine protease
MVQEKQKENEMKKLIVTLTALVILAIGSVAVASVNNYDSIVRIESPRSDTTEFIWTGVGFFVTPNHIVTCAHIINGVDRDYTKDVKINFHGKRYKVKLLSLDTKMDIALLYVKKPLGSPFGICDSSIPGQSVVMNHFDEDLNIVGKVGKIKKLFLGKESLGDIQVGIKIKHGYSGAPVIRNLCIVGMVHNIEGYSIGARNLRYFLLRHGMGKAVK